jgi:hypothetical protein
MAEGDPRENLKLENLADVREKTEMVSQLLLNQLKGHLDTLRPLLAPRRILGNYVRFSVVHMHLATVGACRNLFCFGLIIQVSSMPATRVGRTSAPFA